MTKLQQIAKVSVDKPLETIVVKPKKITTQNIVVLTIFAIFKDFQNIAKTTLLSLVPMTVYNHLRYVQKRLCITFCIVSKSTCATV